MRQHGLEPWRLAGADSRLLPIGIEPAELAGIGGVDIDLVVDRAHGTGSVALPER